MKLGTRASKLALWQAHHVADRLRHAGHEVEVVTFSTKGDRILDTPLSEIGDKGLFTQELDRALLDGAISLAVHSLKDLPTTLPPGLALAAVPERAEPWDAFVAHPDFDGGLADLPEGAVLATSSLRRQAQLKAWRPDLQIVSVRGNVPTRIAKLDASDVARRDPRCCRSDPARPFRPHPRADRLGHHAARRESGRTRDRLRRIGHADS